MKYWYVIVYRFELCQSFHRLCQKLKHVCQGSGTYQRIVTG